MSRLHTYRCSMCNIDWPYNSNWTTCPRCDEPTSAATLREPDRAWSELEAVNYCRQEGLEVPPGAEKVGRTPPPGPPKARRVSQQKVECEVKYFRQELDHWVDRPPEWVPRSIREQQIEHDAAVLNMELDHWVDLPPDWAL